VNYSNSISGDQTMIFQRTLGDEPDDGYSLPIGTYPPQQQLQHEEGQAEAGGVPISDLSSWGSSEDGESLGPQKPALGLFAGGVKKSAGIMDLSKFLTPSGVNFIFILRLAFYTTITVWLGNFLVNVIWRKSCS